MVGLAGAQAAQAGHRLERLETIQPNTPSSALKVATNSKVCQRKDKTFKLFPVKLFKWQKCCKVLKSVSHWKVLTLDWSVAAAAAAAVFKDRNG